MSFKPLFFLCILINFLCFSTTPLNAMEEEETLLSSPETKRKPKPKKKDEVVVVREQEPRGNELTQTLREQLIAAFGQNKSLKIEELDPLAVRSLVFNFPRSFEGEPDFVFFLLPNSLRAIQEERKQYQRKVKELTKTETSLKNLNDYLANRAIEERIPILTFPLKSVFEEEESWDNIPKFLFFLDQKFFDEQKSSCGKQIGKGIFAAIGLAPPLPLCGSILYSFSEVFGQPPDWVNIAAPVWLIPTVGVISVNQFLERGKAILVTRKFISLKEDMRLFNKKYRVNGIISAENEKFNPEIATPHIFQESIGHKVAKGVVALSAGLNSLIPAIVVVQIYKNFDEHVLNGFPLRYFLASFVAGHYGEFYYGLGTERLWKLFTPYRYVGHEQTSEEDSREKRRIMAERIRQFQSIIANKKHIGYARAVYKLILEQRGKRKIQEEDTELEDTEYVSAFSLLMMTDKMRLDNLAGEEEGESQDFRALHFKQDLNVIKASPVDDFLDIFAGVIVGAGFLVDAEVIRYTLQQFFETVIGLDPMTAGEMASFYVVGGLDTTFRGVIEFDLHKENLKGWLKTFSVKHFVDFQWLRKGLGGVSLVNALAYTGPKFFQGWNVVSALTPSWFGRLGLLIPSVLNTISLNQAMCEKHYNGALSEVVTLGNKDKFGDSRLIAQLKKWSDEAMGLILWQFDDETVDKIYSGTQKGM